MADGDLITRTELKLRMETTEDEADAVLDAVITAASQAIARHTGREFAGPGAAEERAFAADGWGDYGLRVGDLKSITGSVVIEDADGVTSVTLTASDFVLTPRVRPNGEPVERIRPKSTVTATLGTDYVVRITGEWGWTEVPADVKEACIQTCRSWLRMDAQRWAGVEVSEGYIVQPTPQPTWMLPMSARQLLAHYRIRGVA